MVQDCQAAAQPPSPQSTQPVSAPCRAPPRAWHTPAPCRGAQQEARARGEGHCTRSRRSEGDLAAFSALKFNWSCSRFLGHMQHQQRCLDGRGGAAVEKMGWSLHGNILPRDSLSFSRKLQHKEACTPANISPSPGSLRRGFSWKSGEDALILVFSFVWVKRSPSPWSQPSVGVFLP